MKVRRYFCAVIIILVILSFAGCNRSNDATGTNMSGAEITIKQGEQTKDNTNAVTEGEAKDNVSLSVKDQLKYELEKKGIAFSKTEYFYDRSIEVEVLSKEEGEIFYTLDGTDPTKESKRYTQPISLSVGSDLQVTCMKAKAFFDDGTESSLIVHTYFLGENLSDRFDTLVFSVTTDPYNLFDYEYGIFVEGKLRDDYIKEHPGEKVNPDAPANYNMRGRESEREVFLEVISSDGSQLLSQAAGIRTYGGWSRAREQKSIKLFARKDYDTMNNKFRYDFFPEKTAANDSGDALDTFKQLVLRNCGNDNGFGFIRDELFQTLAGQAGYLDYEAVRPAALFVNGDYRGFFWLHEVYCDEYFEDHYGQYKGKFEILEGGEQFKKVDSDGANEEAVKEYTTLYNKYAYLDLSVDENYQEVAKVIDVQNYLEYYALQTYIANEDWPHNNYRTYRYYAAEGEDYASAPFDGKWRYLLHDLDYSFGIYGLTATTNTIANYVGEKGEIKDASPLFGQLMRREDCREIFIKKTLDLINGAFSSINLINVLDSMNYERLNELQHTYNRELLEDWVAPTDLVRRLNEIKMFNNKRGNYILSSYQDYFGLSGTYGLSVEAQEGCKLKINSYVSEEAFSGTYYKDYNTEISAILPEGKELDYWIVNGEKVEEEQLIITTDRIKEDVVEVSFVMK